MKRVLVLGAGLVAGPLVRHLLHEGYEVTVASRPPRRPGAADKAAALVAGFANGRAAHADVTNEGRLEELVSGCDLAVSLAPPAFHPVVARHCIAQRKHMVTTSYVSPEMQALDSAAREAGVTVLNEVGVDPGIDHMSAMRIVDDVRRRGGRVTAFRSYCGGLPAPEANDNPLGYKFSWAPRGVLLASRNGARYLLDGREVTVPPPRLFRDMHVLQLGELGDYEAYPNRDSMAYIDIYGLQGIDTIFRGTLRNMGWCDCMYNFRKAGLLELEEVDTAGMTYAAVARRVLGAGPGEDLRIAAARKMQIPPDALPAWNLHWLGMFSDRLLETARTSPLDALGALMFEKLAYAPGERDMLLMFHDIRAELPDGSRERITMEMAAFGIPGGESAMSRTVGLPAAIGVDLILRGDLTTTGVLRPVEREIYEPILDRLVGLGIECKESTQIL